MAVRISLLGVLAACAGCEMPEIGAPPPAGADAGADAGEPDATESTQLVVEFVADPEIPFTEDAGFALQLDRVRIDLKDVRVIGDGGVTTPAGLVLEWRDDRVPYPYTAIGAAPGMYSRVRAAAVAFDLRGSVLLGGQRVPFQLKDEPSPLGVEMLLTDCVVEAGETTRTSVVFRADDAVEELPWDTLPTSEDGVIRLDGADPAVVDLVRNNLVEAFAPDEG